MAGACTERVVELLRGADQLRALVPVPALPATDVAPQFAAEIVAVHIQLGASGSAAHPILVLHADLVPVAGSTTCRFKIGAVTAIRDRQP